MTVPVIVITGPTASGKSAVADLVAETLNVPVISADAMQVYRGMDIGTAKVPVGERRVPLKMVDVADPCEAYSVALYQQQARSLVDDLLAAGKPPVLCGGTGLYIKAVVEDMRFPKGELRGAGRKRYDLLAQEHGEPWLHDLLAQRDPASARLIHPHNVRRVIRALEMLDEGSSYARQQAGFSSCEAVYPHLLFVLTRDRSTLYARIDARVDKMMEEGLVEEVERLVARGASEALTSRQAIGYKEIIEALEGRIGFDQAVELIKQRSRRYAKRQLSWCRRYRDAIWISMDDLSAEVAASRIVARYRNGSSSVDEMSAQSYLES